MSWYKITPAFILYGLYIWTSGTVPVIWRFCSSVPHQLTPVSEKHFRCACLGTWAMSPHFSNPQNYCDATQTDLTTDENKKKYLFLFRYLYSEKTTQLNKIKAFTQTKATDIYIYIKNRSRKEKETDTVVFHHFILILSNFILYFHGHSGGEWRRQEFFFFYRSSRCVIDCSGLRRQRREAQHQRS